MREPLEGRIKEAFARAYEPPAEDLHRMLEEPQPSRRQGRRRLARLGALALVAALAAVAISMPRALVPAPRPTRSTSFPQVYPDYGYLVLATKQDLSGRGGKVYLGVVPSDRGYGIILQTRCAAPVLGSFTKVVGGGQSVRDFLIGISGSNGRPFFFTVAPKPGDHACSANELGTGATQIPAAASSRPQPKRLYVVAAKGIAWRVTLEVYGRLGNPPQLPATLGTCRSSGVGWGGIGPVRRKGGVELNLQPSSVYPALRAPCRLLVPVKLGLFWAGTTKPLPVAGNLAPVRLSGAYSGGPMPNLNWTWSNWCGPRRAVQDVFFGPGGAVLTETTSADPLPVCQDRSSPSRLTVASGG